jgi:hypothetical protein
MHVKIDDDLAAAYAKMSRTIPVETLLERQLARFMDYPPTIRIMPVGGDDLQQLEHLLGGGSIKSPADLVERVRSYASITLGKITLDLSTAQKIELAHRAAKRGISPEAVAKELVEIITEEMFASVTPYR